MHYLFGGNPGENTSRRLDDFWQLELQSTQAEEVLKRVLFLIRRQQFQEMCRRNPIDALSYLQTGMCVLVLPTNHIACSSDVSRPHFGVCAISPDELSYLQTGVCMRWSMSNLV